MDVPGAPSVGLPPDAGDPALDAMDSGSGNADSAFPESGRHPPGGSLRSLLRGNVGGLAGTSFLNDTASEMAYPLLPLLLVGVLGAGPAFLGVVEGIAESTASLAKLGGGFLSDRARRRKALMVWGYGVAAAVRPVLALVTSPWHVLAVRFTDRVGKGIRSAPRDALLADSVPPNLRGTAFGLHRAADHAGAVLGPLLAAGLLVLAPGNLRLVFALTAVPDLLAVLILIRRVTEVVPETPRRTDRSEIFSLRSLGPGFPRYLAVLLLFTLGNASDAFLLLRALDLGVPAAALPLLWGVLHMSKMICNVPGGMLSDRVSPLPMIVLGWLFYSGVYGGFALADSTWHAWALFGVYGLYYGLTESPEKALVAELAPSSLRARAFGAFHFSVGLGALPASLLFGVLWQWKGAPAAFGFGSAVAPLSAALLPFAARETEVRRLE